MYKRRATSRKTEKLSDLWQKLFFFCGRQCIALRGENKNLEGTGNPGNILGLLKLISNHNGTVKAHLASPPLKNATYVSATIQIEEILGKECVLNDIVKEVWKAKFYSIQADDVTSHNTEHFALCRRCWRYKGRVP